MGPRSPPQSSTSRAACSQRCGMTLRLMTRDTTEDVIADVVRELMASHDVEAVGVGAAGFVDAQRSTVLFAPNLAWRDEPLRAAIEDRCGLPVVIENDANAAAWAEARFGAGRGEDHVVILTIGTGLGGGIVHDGRLLRGRFGIAAEIGHINIVPHGRRCGCGLEGCWEQYASGHALVLEAQELAKAAPAMAKDMLRLAGGEPEMITGPVVTEAAREGDVAALKCFDVVGTLARTRHGATVGGPGPGHVRARRRCVRGRRTGPRTSLARVPATSHRPRASPTRRVAHRRTRP